MKSVILIFFMVLSTMLFSQNEPTFYFSASQDIKMSYEGAHGDGGQLNPELIIGFNVNDHVRVWMGYEWLKQIDYQKYTFLAGDYTFYLKDYLEPRFFQNFNVKAGIEGSIIYRDKVNPNDHRFGYQDDWLSFGLNGEIAYKISRTIELFINGNVFLSEPFDNMGNEMKKIRTDVRFGVNIIIFKIP